VAFLWAAFQYLPIARTHNQTIVGSDVLSEGRSRLFDPELNGEFSQFNEPPVSDEGFHRG
jgi:hypothetical protein